MKRAALALVVVGLVGWLLWTKFQPAPPRLKAAFERAKKENRLVFLDFTGSDWCGWCMKLDDEALATPEFIDYSAKYLVTLVVDFPRTHELEPELKKQNQAMHGKYGIEGYPTLLALTPDGKVVWKQVGYVPGGARAVIAPLNRSRLALGWPEPMAAPVTNVAVATSAPAAENSAAAAVATPPTPGPHGLPANAPKLQGIVYSKTNPSVIIEGKECEEGESVRGMKVVKILPDKVVVEWEGRTEELTMN